MEFAINSVILGGVGFLASSWIIVVETAGVFPVILVGLAVLGLGLGLTLASLACSCMDQKMQHFWYVLSVGLSSLAIVTA